MTLDEIEKHWNVNVDVYDESGSTVVYAYTEDGDRIAFEFNSMNPAVDDVFAVARAIYSLRAIANKRPRVGKVS